MHLYSKILFILFSLCIFSCGMSPDDMVQEYNSNLITNVENTIDKTNKVIRLDSLLDWENQEIKKGYQVRMSVNPKYITYEWSLTDTQNNTINIEMACEFAYINTQALGLSTGQYIVTVKVTNKIGNIYVDSGNLIVTE